MKLVELLVKELEEWPDDVTFFVQDVDREVKAGRGSEPIEPFDSSTWIRHTPLDNYNFFSCLCTDWETSVVTKDVYTKHKEKQNARHDNSESFLLFHTRKQKEANHNTVGKADLSDIINSETLMDNLIVIEALVVSRIGKDLGEMGCFLDVYGDTLILDTGTREVKITKMDGKHMTTKEVMKLANVIVGKI